MSSSDGEQMRTAVPTRRDRVRAATLLEIKAAARAALVAGGLEAVSLRAIARELGMTAPALYRYVDSREELLADLVTDLYDEVSTQMEQWRARIPEDDHGARLVALSRAFRAWGMSHPAEFRLVFGTPLAPASEAARERSLAAHRRFGGLFLGTFLALRAQHPFPVPDRTELDQRLVAGLREGAFSDHQLPPGVYAVFLQCWIRLYGTVAMEVFGQLSWATSDAEPLFERELALLCELLHIPPTVLAAGQET